METEQRFVELVAKLKSLKQKYRQLEDLHIRDAGRAHEEDTVGRQVSRAKSVCFGAAARDLDDLGI